MKDLPHHMKKLNRRVIRSMHREEMEEELPSIPVRKQTERQLKKQAKKKMRDERVKHIPSDPTPDEQNKKMKHRVPIFDRNSSSPKTGARPTKKKTPGI